MNEKQTREAAAYNSICMFPYSPTTNITSRCSGSRRRGHTTPGRVAVMSAARQDVSVNLQTVSTLRVLNSLCTQKGEGNSTKNTITDPCL